MRTDMCLRQRHPAILPLWLLASLAACQPAETVGSPEKGKRVALQWCAECHLVSPDQGTIPDRGAPSFREIAKDPDKDLAYLRRFMAELHLPMPTFRLWPEEQGNVLAYIITQGYDH